ncbi:hypothetical protein RJT34_11248 [Clitoria ternatea]|uniref:Photosynthesis system II assembly factor Ycf48/Hcf136-like domain-containing protein n=1 Tax=Clitoria ternatea TaxID=43366 RepID=A0AAN9JLK8_CLITE
MARPLEKNFNKTLEATIEANGAIYVTSNRGYNWKAAVQETVSATLNRTVSGGISGASYYTGTFNTVNRSPDGRLDKSGKWKGPVKLFLSLKNKKNSGYEVKKVVGWEKKRTLHPRRGGGFDGGSIIGRIGFGNWKGIGLVIMAVVAGVLEAEKRKCESENMNLESEDDGRKGRALWMLCQLPFQQTTNTIAHFTT